MRVGNHHSYSHGSHVTRNGFFFFFAKLYTQVTSENVLQKQVVLNLFFFFLQNVGLYIALSQFSLELKR